MARVSELLAAYKDVAEVLLTSHDLALNDLDITKETVTVYIDGQVKPVVTKSKIIAHLYDNNEYEYFVEFTAKLYSDIINKWLTAMRLCFI